MWCIWENESPFISSITHSLELSLISFAWSNQTQLVHCRKTAKHLCMCSCPNDTLLFLYRVERSTDQVIKPVNVEALSKWVGKIPPDVLRDMPVIAPMLARLGYDPHANPPNYGRPDPLVLDNTRRVRIAINYLLWWLFFNCTSKHLDLIFLHPLLNHLAAIIRSGTYVFDTLPRMRVKSVLQARLYVMRLGSEDLVLLSFCAQYLLFTFLSKY